MDRGIKHVMEVRLSKVQIHNPPTFNIRISETRLKLRVITDITESHMYVHDVVIIYTVSDTTL